MTVSSTVSKIDYTGNGTNKTFALTFKIFSATDLYVFVADVLKTLNVDYTVPGIMPLENGSVIFTDAPGSGVSVFIVRILPLTQLTDYTEGDPFPAETHEAALDRLVMIAQQLKEAPAGEPPPPGSDHGTLLGLTDDDHPQYYNAVRHTKSVHDALLVNADTLDSLHVGALEKIANKEIAYGYAGLGGNVFVPTDQLGGGVADNTKFLRGDQTWQTSGGGVPTGSQGDMLYRGTSDWLAGKTEINAKGYGAVGDGTTDDSTAILNAANSLGSTGGTVLLPPPGKYLIDTALTLPANITLKGPFNFVGATNAANYGNMSAIIINSAITIALGAGAGIDGCLIYRKGMTFPVTGPSAFAGTAITFGGDDCFVFNSMILGFNKLIYSTGHQRPRIQNVQGDGVNGIEIINCTDIGRLSSVHLWPFAIYPGSGEYKRSGTAFRFYNGGDWNKATDCFSWGYYRGFDINTCNSMTLLSCGADNPPGEHTDAIGFMIQGGSTDTRLIGCQAAGHVQAGYYVNTSAGVNTRLIGCDAWYTGTHSVLVDAGDVSITGGILRNADAGVTINNTTSKVLIDQVENPCTLPIQYAQANPYVLVGFMDTGTGWVWYGGGGGSGTPGGLDTYVQFNDGGIFGGESSFTWNKTTDLLTALTISSRGLSLTGTAGGSGNVLYINGESTFTGKLIKGTLNSVDKFWFDVNGGLELKDALTLANSKAIYGRDTGGISRDLIYIGNDNKVKIGYSGGTDQFVAGYSGILKGTSGVVSGIALPNDATKYLDGTGAFTVPSGSGGGDMLKSTYDTNNDGIVDNSTLWNGHAFTDYLNQPVKTTSTPTLASLTITGGCALQSDGHILLQNAKGVYGKDPGGNSRKLIDMNSTYTIEIGTSAPGGISLGYGGGDANPVLIRVGGVNSKKIEVGDANSGGTNYRMLRVLN